MKKSNQKRNINALFEILPFSLLLPMLSTGQAADQNWMKQIIYKVPSNVVLTDTAPQNAQVSVTYADGLGRPIESLAGSVSTTGKDIVTHIEYDAFGRQEKSFLPYVSGDNVLSFNPGAVSEPDYGNELPYSRKLLEDSPRSRVLKMAAPGNNWAMGTGHEIKLNYDTNSASDYVKRLRTANYSILDEGYYPDNAVFKNITTDENGHVTAEFLNLKRQVILKRAYLSATAFADTYYVYEEIDLAVVIPPLAAATDLNSSVLDALCYQYRYDSSHRLIKKRVPGKNHWEYIIYDALDRVVATGPSLSPFGSDDIVQGWLITRYDQLNRVAYTGWHGGFDESQVSGLQAANAGGVTNTSKTTDIETAPDNAQLNYTVSGLPSDFILLTVNYYDDYNFPGGPMQAELSQHSAFYDTNKKPIGLATGSWIKVLLPDQTSAGETTFIVYDYRARPTYTVKTNYLGGHTKAYTEYNFAQQAVSTFTEHRKDANTEAIIIRDNYFYMPSGQLLKHTQKINGSAAVPAAETLAENHYTPLGRLQYKLCGGPAGGSEPLQKIDYAYNIRGWLTGINDTGALVKPGDVSDLFAFKINYDQPLATLNAPAAPQFNGNISETLWRSSSDNVLRRYGYAYDAMNRLTDAVYRKPNTTATANSYGEHADYDINGNITSMLRNGNLDNNIDYINIDELRYTYEEAGGFKTNRLLQVYDVSDSSAGFKDDVHNAPDVDDDYSYDSFGNLTADQNKHISVIKYNHLNLPVEIDFDFPTESKITYIYAADGSKVGKTVLHGNTVEEHYLDGFRYRNGKMQHFATSEGYVSVTQVENGTNRYNYVYNYLDHLGNIRLSYGVDPRDNALKILEENHYYPYGLKHANYNTERNEYKKEGADEGGSVALKTPDNPDEAMEKYKYKFNGMEWQDELGLNLYDMDMRDYDPAIGRWMGIDPVTHFNQSPYMAFNGNPVTFADPSGADGITITIDWNQLSNNAATVIQHADSNTSALDAFQMAVLSADVYGGAINVSAIGYTRDTSRNIEYNRGSIGFKSMLYNRTDSNKYVYATAGTEEGVDWWNNATQLVGLSEQYDLSVKNAQFLKTLFGNNLSFTGHSLGGGLAEANAIATGLKAITFNAAALSEATKTIYGSGKSNTNAYIMMTDPLNAVQSAAGNMAGGNPHFIPPVNLSGIYNGHSIYSVLKTLNFLNGFD